MTTPSKFGEWIESYRNGYGKRPGVGEAGPIVLRIADVSTGEIDLSTPRRGEISAKDAATYGLHNGDLLFVRVNGSRDIVGRCCVIRPDLPADTIFNDHLIRARLKSGLDPEFAKYWLGLPHARQIIEKAASTSAGQLTISQQVLDSIEIPDIHLDYQRTIAARIKTQLASVEEARQATKAQLRELTHLANAIIRETLAHPDTETQSLGEVLEEVKQGIGNRWAEFPVLGATRDGLAPAKEPVGKKPERYKLVQVGTVFYNPMRILIGSIAMVDEGDAPGITSPDYVALRGRTGLVDSRWFYYWLRSPEGEHCIASLARGAVRERMLFNRLAEGAIKLPPYPVQQTASQALSELHPLRQSIEAQLRDIELLPSRLLARTFDSIEDTPDARPVN